LEVDARLGHARLAADGVATTFVSVEVRGSDRVPRERPPLHMALVVDRSGSMNGERLRQAIEGARGVVSHLADGDRVTVVSFDQDARVEVPTTTLGPSTRTKVLQDISGIELGGSTCISCGIDQAIDQLKSVAGDSLQRVIVLSDGEANHGIREVRGFTSLAKMCRRRGIAISTVGVGLDYNERVLATLAFESNGRHHFVENERSLAGIFEAETRDAIAMVASGATASIDLAPGVELVRVLDRSYSRDGSRVDVPLGTFAPGETKTVLLEVRVPARQAGPLQVADVKLSYRDLVDAQAGARSGRLAVQLAETSDALDPLVAARVERSLTAAALEEANELAARGDLALANAKLQQRARDLEVSADKAKQTARKRGGALSDKVGKDFDDQWQAAQEAADGFSPSDPSPSTAPPRQRTVKSNAERAMQLQL
jgi:Ca-activated chloride channel family protein